MSRNSEMMNCNEYKEALAAEPDFEDESGHVDACADCQSFRKEMREFNSTLAAAMQLSVPELNMPALPDLDTANVTTLPARRSIPKPAWFALAATVLMAAFIGIRTVGVDNAGSLEQQLLAHLDHEPYALRVTTKPVSDARLARIVSKDVATMNHDAGLITYAQSCQINGKNVPHLVVQGEFGPVTILLMPDEKISAAQSIDGDSIQGVILPVGDGSVAIIGNREEQLERVKKNVIDSVAWST